MPSADRYTRYRADQTTAWISKSASDFIKRERTSGGEGTAAVLDRLINELKRQRRANPGLAPERPAVTAASKSAGKAAAKGGAKRAAKSAGKAASKRAAR